jgi:DNA-directed RNA polymerase specialized sigma24 family protein
VVELDIELADRGGFDPAEHAEDVDLRRAVERLSADDRALLALRYEAGLDSAEIGALAGRPAATIRWRSPVSSPDFGRLSDA